MHKRILIACALTIFSFSTNADIKLSKYAKVYKGHDGAVVTLVPLSPKDENKALIQVSGIDTEIDGLIFLYYLEKQGTTEAYKMKYDGRAITRLRTKKGYWSSGIELYLPDLNDGIRLYYDEKASKQVDISTFSKRYQEQEKRGLQKKLAEFNREKHVEVSKTRLAERAGKAKAACGKTFGIEILWDNFTQEQLHNSSVATYCGLAFSEIADICKQSAESKAALEAKIDAVSCTFGEKPKLRINGKTLHWITGPGKGIDQGDFVKYYLMNEL